MKITANGYEYHTCACDEPATDAGVYELVGAVDYQVCERCRCLIPGTAATHHEGDEDEDGPYDTTRAGGLYESLE